MTIRRTGAVTAVAALIALAALAAAPAGAATGGGGCQLVGTANISPALGSASQSFSYSFTGNLGQGSASCQSNISGAPATGTASAGIQLSETVTLTNNTTGAKSTGTVSYQEPVPQGTGSCGSSTTSGQALVTWGNGKHTVADYSTSGALAAINLEGTVGSGMTLSLVASSVPAGFSAPATYGIPSDEPSFPAGQQAEAALTFSPTTQDQDCVTKGVSSAAINGVVTIGSAT